MYEGVGLITIAVALAYMPIAILTDWFGFFKGLPPREAELAKGSHGAAVIVCGWYALRFSDVAPTDYRIWLYGGYAALVCLGLFWLMLGWSRAQIYGDARLKIRAIMKILVGTAAYYLWHAYRFRLAWYWWLADPILPLFWLWCWTTGAVKFVICMRSLPRPPRPPSDDDYYGGAKFPDRAGGLRGN
jgi:hypothetical protein